jgi:type I restriction enzyme R subunit
MPPGRHEQSAMNKKVLSERDICSKFITPALQDAGWDLATQIREEFDISPGRIIVRGKVVSRGRPRRG